MTEDTTVTASPLDDLLAAKEHSDKGDYGSKTHLVRNLLHKFPKDFVVDTPEGQFVGITHVPTGFKMHISRAVVPLELFKNQREILKSQNDIVKAKRDMMSPQLEALKEQQKQEQEAVKAQQKQVEQAIQQEQKQQEQAQAKYEEQLKKEEGKRRHAAAVNAFSTAYDRSNEADDDQEKSAAKTMVISGIHGDEPAGDEAADKLTGVDKITRVNKTGKRRIDGKDPNRHFDKDTESKLQRDILNKIEEKNPDLVVAMHEDDEAKKPYAYASKSVAGRLKDILKDKDTARSAHGDKTDGGVISEGNNPKEGSLEKALDRRGIDRITLETPSKTQSLNERVSTQTDIVNQLKEKSAAAEEALMEKLALYWTDDLTRDIMGGRHYDTAYLTGELSELGESVKNLDWENFKEEMGDTAYAAQMLAGQKLGINIPVIGADKVIKKFYNRIDNWKKIFADKNVPFSVDYLKGGSNYAKPEKIQKAFELAGKPVSEDEAKEIASTYGSTAGIQEEEQTKSASDKPRHELIIGPSGAGKTTLAKALAEQTGMPVINLDKADPKWREFVMANDNLRNEDNIPLHLIEGTKTNKQWKKLMRSMVEAALAMKEPHIIEGTHLMTLTPEELKNHNLHVINPSKDEVINRREARMRQKEISKGHEPGTYYKPEDYENSRIFAGAFYDKLQPTIKEWESLNAKVASAQVLQAAGVPVKDPTEILPGGRMEASDDITAKAKDPNIPTTGPAAIAYRLKNLDLAAIEQKQRDLIKSGKVSKRSNAVKTLNILEGFKRNNLTGADLTITKVPVIPPVFRPFRMAGSTFVPGDANELYRDLFTMKKLHKEVADELGDENSGDARMGIYNAVKAVYGFGDPVNPKTASRGVTGFFKKVTGTNPKYSFVQRQLLSKPQDTVSRGTITINPDLTMNQVGVPKDMAWKMYSSYVQRRLVNLGYSPGDAVKAIKDQNDDANRALQMEVKERPVIVSRAPAWHKFNAVAANPVLVEGNTVEINPFITTGMNADFDGDAMNVHVPASDEAVKEAYEKLLPSKMLFTIRDPDKVMPNLKHEQILSLYGAVKRPATKKWKFNSEAEALRAIKAGDISLSDEVEYPGLT